MKVLYAKAVEKRVRKRQLPREVWVDFRDAFQSLSQTRNFRLFDIKRLVGKGPYIYYRMRIGQYRALFHADEKNFYVEDIGPRGEIYR